jgi:hypothetical protein
MRIPKDSLEEFFANRVAPKPPPPPPEPVQLEFTGETETLKPLAHWEPPIRLPAAEAADRSARPYLLSWFHRSLVFGGALATLVLVLGTGMFFALFGPPVQVVSGPDIANNSLPIEALSTAEEVGTADLFTSDESAFTYNAPAVVRSTAKRRTFRPRVRSASSRPRVLFAANRAPRRHTPVPKMIWSDFVPTNMIIFVENGAIKTRIEPQLTAVYKRSPAGSQ